MKHLRILRYVDEVARTGSIRKAADHLNVTASAVNRRIMDLEEELGSQLFERRPRGVRLTAAGEVFVHYLREQMAYRAVKSQSGFERHAARQRAHCLQPGFGAGFLAARVSEFRGSIPRSFDIKVFDHERAMAALADYEVDLVLVFRPPFLANFQPLMTIEQRIVGLMSSGHPLASRQTVRLRDCAAYPVALPERSIGGRQLLEEVCARSKISFQLAAESNSFELLRGLVTHANLISFQIRIGTMPRGNKLGLITRDIDDRDVPRANRARPTAPAIPIPAAIFAERLMPGAANYAATKTSPPRVPGRPNDHHDYRSSCAKGLSGYLVFFRDQIDRTGG